MDFPNTGGEISLLVLPLFTLVISFFASMGGLSGAFLLLPFQVSVLGITGPAASSTNLLYNIVAIPGGAYRYIRDGRMYWPLFTIISAGTLPGIITGTVLRVSVFHDPGPFKFFVGLVLLCIGVRLLLSALGRADRAGKKAGSHEAGVGGNTLHGGPGAETRTAPPAATRVETRKLSLNSIEYSFCGEVLSFNPVVLTAVSFFVGIIGGIYGIGGGAIIGPLLVTVFRLSIFTVTGANLLATLACSVTGVLSYTLVAPRFAETGGAVAPDWKLGLLFGLGGLVGTYFGAMCQKYVPARAVKLILAACIFIPAVGYIAGFITGLTD